MRRQTPDLTYKDRTASIVEDHFDLWQLTRRDPRDGTHRLVNTIVSLIEELDVEADYIERMFIPDRMDLSEPWVMYHSYPEYPMADLYISGQIASGTVSLVTSIDDFLAGDIDELDHEFTISGTPYAESILAISMDQIFLLGSGIITEYDLQDQEYVSSGEVDYTIEVIRTFYADKDHPVFPIREDFREDSLTVEISGQVVSYELEMAEDMTGSWNDEFDVNKDGYIGDYERGIIEASMGVSQQQVSPTVWETYDWMDVNKDGTISESDYNAVMTSVTSAAPDVTGVVKVPRSVIGALEVSYDKKLPISKHLFRSGNSYSRLTDLDTIYDSFSKVTYDTKTDVYYGINSDGTELRVFKYDALNDSIVNDLLVLVNRWDHDCVLIDLDAVDGFLYVLASDSSTTKMFYGNIWGEATYRLPNEVDIPDLDGETPIAMTSMENGYFVILVGNTLKVFSPVRDKAIDLEGVGYFNKRYDLELEDGTNLKTIPSYIFNSFDSFAYSAMGLSRPPGCDNFQMRKLIMDFWQHPPGNDKLGMNFGIMRELGLVNDDTIVSGTVYHLPAELTYSGEPPDNSWDLIINDCPMSAIEQSDGSYMLSGSIGTLTLINGDELIPGETVTTVYDSLVIEGYFLDGNNDVNYLSHTLDIDKGKHTPDISVRTYGDMNFLEDVGYVVSGEPIQEFIDIVFDAEDTNPFVYGNAVTNQTPMDSNRVSDDPVMYTIYDVSLSGLLTTLEDVEVDL